MEDHHGWMVFGALLASRKAGESARAAVPGIRDIRLRKACVELLDGKPGPYVADVLKFLGAKGQQASLWERAIEALIQRTKAAQAKRLADALKLSVGHGDFENAGELARKLVEELGGEV